MNVEQSRIFLPTVSDSVYMTVN